MRVSAIAAKSLAKEWEAFCKSLGQDGVFKRVSEVMHGTGLQAGPNERPFLPYKKDRKECQ